MSVIVPFTSNDHSYEFNCSLNGVSYRFDVRWNVRWERWVFDLYLSDDDTLLVAGLPILLGGNILGAYEYLGIGGLYAVDLDGTMQKGSPNDTTENVLCGTDAGEEDLGVRVKVFFYTPAEMLEAGL